MTLRVLMLMALLGCRAEPEETGDTGEPVDTADTADSAPPDADGDGSPDAEDCDDTNPAVNPAADEVCNDVDDDCDGTTDIGARDAGRWYDDDDGDGYGVELLVSCEQPEGSAAAGGDCDDGDAATHPNAEEPCDDPVDRNCDGSVSYADVDEDGVPACEDCDDTNAAAAPGALEVCDGADNDCDTEVDEAGAEGESTWYADADTDGWGDASAAVTACDAPEGFVADATDCDDTNTAINPAATEVCDDADVDEDCDGQADDAGAGGVSTWYADSDGDGWGDASATLTACDASPGYVSDNTDCMDTDASVNPAAAEVCGDAVDQDCDGADPACDTGSPE
jgi:hypothetical protein